MGRAGSVSAMDSATYAFSGLMLTAVAAMVVSALRGAVAARRLHTACNGAGGGPQAQVLVHAARTNMAGAGRTARNTAYTAATLAALVGVGAPVGPPWWATLLGWAAILAAGVIQHRWVVRTAAMEAMRTTTPTG